MIKKSMQLLPNKRFESAEKLLKTLNQIKKLDKRYKSFLLKQEIAVIATMLFFAASVLSIYQGKTMMQSENKERYEEYIEQMLLVREDEDSKLFDELYEKATALFPGRLDAFYQKSLNYYEDGLYQTGIDYMELMIEKDYPQAINPNKDFMMGDIRFLLGNCYLELDDYENASNALNEAIQLNPNNSEYYRDYAISLARLNQTGDASEVLTKALSLGLKEDSIYLVKGEIDLANGDYEAAVDNFNHCIKKTTSDYSSNRAYVMCSKTYEQAGNLIKDSMSKNIALLEEATIKLPPEMTMIVNQRLAEAYVEYGNEKKDHTYYQKAIDTFSLSIDMGWGSYSTYNNMSVLYRKLGDYTKTYDVLQTMLKKYGEKYNTYKRLAYLEVDIQENKANEERDYHQFKEYYDKAFILYEEEKEDNQIDTEMDYLSKVYQEIVAGNWLE